MRPESTWCPSPNFKASTKARGISVIVIHATATSGIESPKNWLCDPKSKVSAHYIIGRAGELLHLVQDSNVAYHAGESSWRGREHVNSFSIGIELVNSNDGIMEYPEPQLAVCAALTAALCKEHGVKLGDVVGHKDIAPGRKTDPAGFDWVGFRDRLLDLGVS